MKYIPLFLSVLLFLASMAMHLEVNESEKEIQEAEFASASLQKDLFEPLADHDGSSWDSIAPDESCVYANRKYSEGAVRCQDGTRMYCEARVWNSDGKCKCG